MTTFKGLPQSISEFEKMHGRPPARWGEDNEQATKDHALISAGQREGGDEFMKGLLIVALVLALALYAGYHVLLWVLA